MHLEAQLAQGAQAALREQEARAEASGASRDTELLQLRKTTAEALAQAEEAKAKSAAAIKECKRQVEI